MDCPPVSPGGERGPRGSPGTGRGGGAHREPVVKVGSAPGARPGRGEAGRRGSGIGSWRGWGVVPVVLRGSPLRLGRHREHGTPGRYGTQSPIASNASSGDERRRRARDTRRQPTAGTIRPTGAAPLSYQTRRRGVTGGP